jgi:hypothetical protein
MQASAKFLDPASIYMQEPILHTIVRLVYAFICIWINLHVLIHVQM